MLLTLETATIVNGVFYWDIPLDKYVIQSLVFTSTIKTFYVKCNQANENLEYYVEIDRMNSCSVVLSDKPFSVSFYINGLIPYSQIDTLTIELVPS
jgi:hypothetical protein